MIFSSQGFLVGGHAVIPTFMLMIVTLSFSSLVRASSSFAAAKDFNNDKTLPMLVSTAAGKSVFHHHVKTLGKTSLMPPQNNRNLQSRSSFCNDVEDIAEDITSIAYGGEIDCDCRSTSSRYYVDCELQGQLCCDDECFKVYHNFEFTASDFDIITEEVIFEYDGVHGDATRQIVQSYCSRDGFFEYVPCSCSAYVNGKRCDSCSICIVANQEGDVLSYAVEDCSNIRGFEFINYDQCPSFDLYLTQDHKDGLICDDPVFVAGRSRSTSTSTSNAPALYHHAMNMILQTMVAALFVMVVPSFI